MLPSWWIRKSSSSLVISHWFWRMKKRPYEQLVGIFLQVWRGCNLTLLRRVMLLPWRRFGCCYWFLILIYRRSFFWSFELLWKISRNLELWIVEWLLCFSLESSAHEFDDELACLELMLIGTILMLQILLSLGSLLLPFPLV